MKDFFLYETEKDAFQNHFPTFPSFKCGHSYTLGKDGVKKIWTDETKTAPGETENQLGNTSPFHFVSTSSSQSLTATPSSSAWTTSRPWLVQITPLLLMANPAISCCG